MSGRHYTRKQHQQVMEYWFKVAVPQGWSQQVASQMSRINLGFHVPASTLSLWINKYRKHRKAKTPTLAAAKPKQAPKHSIKTKELSPDRILVTLSIDDVSHADDALKVFAGHIRRFQEQDVNAPADFSLNMPRHKKVWWKLW